MSDRKRVTLLPFDDIDIGTEPEYVIEGLIPSEGLTLVWGPPKSHKSFWTYDAAMHVALGWEYRGRRVRQGNVVYCAFEGQHGFKKRIVAFRQRFLKDHREPVPFYLQAARLDLIKDVGKLIEAIGKGALPHLIVLDTLNRSLVGSENKDEDMSAYIAAADRLRQQFLCAVVIVHHCGVEAGRPRGHSSLTGAADAQLAVRRTGKTSTLTVEFMKDGDEGGTLASRLDLVEVGQDAEGNPITSCVIVPFDGPTPKQDKRDDLSKRQLLAYDALVAMAAKHGEKLPAAFELPQSLRCVPVDAWRTELFARGIIDKDGSNPRRAFSEICTGLQAKSSAAEREGLIWPII